MTGDADLDGAERAAYRLIAYRARSVEELRERLRKKGYGERIAGAVIERLLAAGYLDDDAFAFEWARSHAVHRLWSNMQIAAGLRVKGVPGDTIRRAIDRVRDEFSERDAVARLMAKKKRDERHTHMDGTPRLARNLLARGFPPSVVSDMLRHTVEDDIDYGK